MRGYRRDSPAGIPVLGTRADLDRVVADTGAAVVVFASPRRGTGHEPHQLLQDEILGIRHPATTPPAGAEITRGFGIAFHERFVPMDIDYAAAHNGVIVDG